MEKQNKIVKLARL